MQGGLFLRVLKIKEPSLYLSGSDLVCLIFRNLTDFEYYCNFSSLYLVFLSAPNCILNAKGDTDRLTMYKNL